jgi:hypothetical protein
MSVYNASVLRQAARTSSVAINVQSITDKAARDARQEKLAEEFTDYVQDCFPSAEECARRAGGGQYGMAVANFLLPGKVRDQTGSLVPKNAPSKVYFSGYEKGLLKDPRSDGIPAITLIQGERPAERGVRSDPSTCPGGRSLLVRLNARLDDGTGNSCQMRTIFSTHKGLQVCLVWDPESWDQQQVERQLRNKGGGRGQGRGGGQSRGHRQPLTETDRTKYQKHSVPPPPPPPPPGRPFRVDQVPILYTGGYADVSAPPSPGYRPSSPAYGSPEEEEDAEVESLDK